MASLLSAAEPVSIQKSKYEELLRDSERVSVLKRIVRKKKYISLSEIRMILDMEDDAPAPEMKHPSVNLDDYAD